MDLASRLFVFFIFYVFIFSYADSDCPKSFRCGDLSSLQFPLTDSRKPDCGLYSVDCENPTNLRIQLSGEGTWYKIVSMTSPNTLLIEDPSLRNDLKNLRSCLTLRNLSLPVSPSSSLTFFPNITLFTCDNKSDVSEQVKIIFIRHRKYTGCQGFTVYYRNSTERNSTDEFLVGEPSVSRGCTVVQMPVKRDQDSGRDLFDLLSAEMEVQWNVSPNCRACNDRGGQCLANNLNEFRCKEDRNRPALIVAAAISGGSVILVACIFTCFIIYHRKKKMDGAYITSKRFPSKSEGSFNFGVTIFSYNELEEATNNFDSAKEIGDGGFGTVYYGKLKDGREVAIKRLYEHNYKRVEQFINEIKILTCLRHPNLVSLYGCTSRRSRQLLLVYEYISNGTLADHLHGENGKTALLTWAIRMNIAVETASALAYLHKSDIIHRDVKTNNILLDSSFCVKVADFGISRLFPTHVTHISTAPQGTPGYVDPEYHQCYQLTDKSDVYSFGVVLVELISSMPAVDISRHRHEINLANLAVNMIQRCEFDKLIDSSVGYNTDPEVTRMTTSVAELAFQCLQLEKELRPSMDEVLDFLKGIQAGEECKFEKRNANSPSPEADKSALLKKNCQQSPIAVMDAWVSGSTTSSTG